MTGYLEPRPYVPRLRVVVPDHWPEDHIDAQGRSRLYHQCYRRCGFTHDDLAVLNQHEDEAHG